MRYAHTNIIARDWQALSKFYIDVFACKMKPPLRDLGGEWLAKGTGVPEAALIGVHLLLPGHGAHGPTLEIFTYADTVDQPLVKANQRGFGHLAFEVEDVASCTASVLAHGGRMAGDIVTRDVPGAGILTFVYVRDPEGNLVELQSWRPTDPC